jgi:hypothetical protein
VPPHILQSDNGREFTADIKELKVFWPDLAIVHGKPRHPQSQGSEERSNADIHGMIVSCMRDNDTTKWAVVSKFIQFQKNRHKVFNVVFVCFPFPDKFGQVSLKIC